MELLRPVVHPDSSDVRIFQKVLGIPIGAEADCECRVAGKIVVPIPPEALALNSNHLVNNSEEAVAILLRVIATWSDNPPSPSLVPLIDINWTLGPVPEKRCEFSFDGSSDIPP